MKQRSIQVSFLSKILACVPCRLKRASTVFSVVVAIQLLASCNVPTLEQDAKNAARQAKDVAEDTYDTAKQKVDQTFDPETNDLIDPNLGLSRDDYRRELIKPGTPTIEDRPPDPILPDVSQLLVAPRPPVIGQDKLVTLSVTEDVPLKEVLIELARRADVDVEVDPGIAGGIIFRAKDKPFSEVLERICELAGLRYSIKNGVLKVERDSAYIVNYNVDILNLTRSSAGSVNISTQVLSAVAGAGSGGGGANAFSTGSTNTLSSSSDGNVWAEVEKALQKILDSYGGAPGTLAQGAGAAADAALNDVLGQPSAAPRGGAAPAAAGGSAILSVNKQSGIVSVLATEKQHKAIKQYLERVTESQAAQVLIEAKIVEVALNDRYRSGVRWDLINKRFTDFNIQSGFTNTTGTLGNQVLQFTTLPSEIFGIDDVSLETAVSLIQEFGVTRTLSSPRINAMNNQQAVLTFAENFVYFDLDVQEQRVGTGAEEETNLTVQSNVRTVPIGVILTLQPTIDLRKGEVVMNIRPTLSRITESVSDPGVALLAARTNSNVTSSVPIVEVREIDSILRIKSGQVMVIGGLMTEKSVNQDTGVPGLQSVPYIGNIFKSVDKQNEVVETVIFIKATIVPSQGVSREDKDLYRKFTNDRRPLTF
jgi:general secretion pathway protein D